MPQAQQGFNVTSSSQLGTGVVTSTAILDATIAAADIASNAVTEAKQLLSDVTTDDVSTSAHGYAPKLPNDTTKYLDGIGTYKQVLDSELSTSDITTNDVSITKHGFVPKAPNLTTQYLRGDGTWAAAGIQQTQSGAQNTKASTSAEQNVFTYTCLGNTLGTTGGIKFWIPFSNLAADANHVFTFKLYYGATSISIAGNIGATALNGVLEGAVFANAATNAQRLVIRAFFNPNKDVSVTFNSAYSQYATGTAAIDSTANQTLKVTATMDTSNASTTWTADGVLVDLM